MLDSILVVVGFIGGLLKSRSPFAVLWAIWTVIINALDRVFRISAFFAVNSVDYKKPTEALSSKVFNSVFLSCHTNLLGVMAW